MNSRSESGQVELLLGYRADLAGKTASEHTRTSGSLPLTNIIHTHQFDRQSFFLFGGDTYA